MESKRFIKDALDKLKEGMLHREEVSHWRELQTALCSEDIIYAITMRFNVSREKLFKNKSKYRNIAIFLLKKISNVQKCSHLLVSV